MAADFSLVLPEGGRVAVKKTGTCAAFAEARAVNASRAARGVALVTLLHWPTGEVIEVPPDADALDMADRFDGAH